MYIITPKPQNPSEIHKKYIIMTQHYKRAREFQKILEGTVLFDCIRPPKASSRTIIYVNKKIKFLEFTMLEADRIKLE